MALTFEQWKKTLDTVNPNKGDIFEQIKVRLKAENTDTYQEWERKEFDINHLFSILLTIGSCQNNLEFELFLNLFRIAAYNGHLDMVKHLAALGNVKVDEKDNNGNTALHLTASNGHLETVKYLIEQGIDVHAKNQFGEAALHLAASNGYLETVKYLIEQGANVEERNNWNIVALHLAASNGHLETVKYLIKQGIDIDIESEHPLLTIYLIRFLSHAAKSGNTGIAKVLEGFDVKVQSERGDGILLFTTMRSHINIVKALTIVAGIDCTLSFNQIKKTPMFLAAWSGHTGVVKALAKAGADVNVQNNGNHGETLLHFAAEHDHIDMVKALIEAGADVNKADKYRETPLHYAAINGHRETVAYLVKNGAGVNVQNNEGDTPLHLAARLGHLEIVEALIEEGADVNEVDENRRTPLHNAISSSHIEVCQTILSHIARLEASDLYVSQSNLDEKVKFISTSYNRHNDYLQCFKNCQREVQKIKERNELLYDFLREDDVNKMADIWVKNRNVRNEFDDEENLEKRYPEYAHILINKANKVKKEIFLHNHKPLISVLSENSREGFQKISFTGVKNFFMSHRNDYNYIQQETGVTLMNCWDFEDVKEKHVPKLKLMTFVQSIENKDISSNLECSNTEQLQELHRAFN